MLKVKHREGDHAPRTSEKETYCRETGDGSMGRTITIGYQGEEDEKKQPTRRHSGQRLRSVQYLSPGHSSLDFLEYVS